MSPVGVIKITEVDDASAVGDVISGTGFQTKDIATPQADPGAGTQFSERHINSRYPVDPASVVRAKAATKRAAEKKITFGEALHELNAEGFTVMANPQHQERGQGEPDRRDRPRSIFGGFRRGRMEARR